MLDFMQFNFTILTTTLNVDANYTNIKYIKFYVYNILTFVFNIFENSFKQSRIKLYVQIPGIVYTSLDKNFCT